MLYLRSILPHLCLIGSLIMIVLLVIDRINPAMHIVGGHIVFNSFLFVFSVLVFIFSVERIIIDRKGRQ